MNLYQQLRTLKQPNNILANFTLLNSQDGAFLRHPVVQRFGNPEHPIYVDQFNTDTEKQPFILPIVNGELENLQYAVLLNDEVIELTVDGENSDGIAKGFAYFGTLQKDKPIIITYGLETFFKVAQTDYAVVLVVLSNLCHAKRTELKPFDFEQIQFVINQLSQSGYEQLYMPVRAEHIKNLSFQNLEKNTSIRLFSQCHTIDGNDFICELLQHESKEDVKTFLDDAISLLPKQILLPKGHLAKPMKWEDGYFHILEDVMWFR